MVGIFDPACELLPPWTKELNLCIVDPLPFPNKMYSIYRQCVTGGGGGGFNRAVYQIMQEF
jgi:hypothetical protein